VSEADRFPDRGDVSVVRSAGWQLEDVAAEVLERRQIAVAARGRVSDQVWAGQGAQAMVASCVSVEQLAEATAQGWARVSQALIDYANGLFLLQEEGDAIRWRLSNAEQEVAAYQAQLTSARSTVDLTDSAGHLRVVSLERETAEARTAVRFQERLLEELGERRRALDARIIAALQTAPGPGAAAWTQIAYRSGGSARDVDDVVEDLLERIDSDQRTGADYDLVAQFLMMYSADDEVMARFYDGLGPGGLAGFMAEFPTADDLHHAFRGGVSAATLSGLLGVGLATASSTWDAPTAQGWGAGLVDTMDGYARSMIVPSLLGTPGLNPQVAVGAFTRVEQIRADDPERFALITRASLPTIDFYGYTRAEYDAELRRTLGGSVPTLMGAIFDQLTAIPAQAMDLLGADGVGDYWFGRYDWGDDGFEGPAALIDAIVNNPEALPGRLQKPVSDLWVRTVEFAALAVERLGGNEHLQVGTMSAAAQLDTAQALATFVPEIGAELGGKVERGTGSRGGDLASVLIDGRLVEVPAFGVPLGNLSRLLGIATTDLAALGTIGAAVGDYGQQVFAHVTGPGHPDRETAEKLLRGLGGVYGLTQASCTAEAAHHAEALDTQSRKDLDTMMRIIGIIPGVSTGQAAVDWLIDIAAGNLDLLAQDHWGDMLSPDEITAIRESATGDITDQAGIDRGHATLQNALDQGLVGPWEQIDPAYPTTAQTLVNEAMTEYGDKATALNSDTSDDMYDVTTIDDDGELHSVNRGDMP
jgi:hypothetical protein